MCSSNSMKDNDNLTKLVLNERPVSEDYRDKSVELLSSNKTQKSKKKTETF